ncbi:MAG: flagellar biosynthetic protein FliR [Planctomycetota bacterium]
MSELIRLIRESISTELLQLFLLLGARLFPIVTFSPLFGGQHVPLRYRIGVTMLLATTMLPLFLPTMPDALDPIVVFGLMAKEALLGLSLAIIIRMLFEMVAATGAFIDLARGATIANVLDPQARAQNSVLSVFFLNFFLAIFFTVGGHRVLFDAIATSYEAYAPWDALPAQFYGQVAAFALVSLLIDLFIVALQLAVPVIAVMFITDVSMGLLNQVTPKIQAFFLAMTVKATLGLFILLLVFGVTVDAFLEQAIGGITRWGESF